METSTPSRPRASAQGLATVGLEGLRMPSISESNGATAMLYMLVASGSPWSIPVVEENSWIALVLSLQIFGAGS
eukprot:5394606-Prorocentrum_lima.AAC.1